MSLTSIHRAGSRGCIASAMMLAGLMLAPGAADAATIVVNTTDDGASVGCTLRNAITAANDNTPSGNCGDGDPSPTVDLIDITAIGTINATSQMPTITDDVDIQGPGAGQLDVHRSDSAVTNYALFDNLAGKVTTISGLQVSNGAVATPMFGGGIVNGGTLTLDGVRVTGNSASDTSSTADSIIAAGGGGIYNAFGAVLTVRNSEISGNTATATNTGTGGSRATAFGAGIDNSGILTIEDSRVSGNMAMATDTSTDPNTRAAAYGGIVNGGTLTVRRTTVSGNLATATQSGTASNARATGGGGIFLFGPTVVELSTIAGNSATASGGTSRIAVGGLYNGGGAGAVTASSSTISGNTGASGANFFGTGTPAETVVENTIVADPSGGSNCGGSFTSNGHNLEDGSAPGTCDFAQATDLHAEPLLDPAGLADNGGPTETIALDLDSPAIDTGASSGETTDQRGEPRPFGFPSIADASGGDGADIGAFELESPLAIEAKLTANKKRVREDNKAKLKVKVTPCRIAAGDRVKLYRGSRQVGKKDLNSECKATFRKKIKRKSKFKAKVPADSEHRKDTSNKVTVRLKR